MSVRSSVLERLRANERETKKSLIMDVFIALAEEEKSFARISLGEIANAVGISTTTIYQYFQNKDDLLVETFLRELHNIDEYITEKLESEKNPSVQSVIWGSIDYLLDHESSHQVLNYFMLQGNMTPEIMDRIAKMPLSFLDVVSDAFADAGLYKGKRFISHIFLSVVLGGLMAFKSFGYGTADEIRSHLPELTQFAIHSFFGGRNAK
ncbi:TetR/AcrR family transcriptional regulator [Desulforegula conservatrix]|uniref:TetR/AcrR family transcriptional regulator n=1 Tax=Desulforegula conservatrix TaxID=153026 RepID=UPI000420A011|nr:TetR/AcrR family transcriptional regulator [Desulforegula conservatrix]